MNCNRILCVLLLLLVFYFDCCFGRAIVLSPSDAGFYNASLDWNQGLCRPTPALIVFAQNSDDVSNAVKYAQSHNLSVSVRSGRHSYECFSVGSNSVVIDVSNIRHISVVPPTGSNSTWLVNVGPGVQLIELYAELWNRYQLVFPGGSCPTVAVGGFTLGGGYGFLSRYLGLAIDQLRQVDIITSTGEITHVSSSSSSSQGLLWALQGAGNGNFGVVTNMTLVATLLPASERFSTVHYSVYWNVSDAVEVYFQWQKLAPSTDNRLTLSFTVYQSNVKALAQFMGTLSELQTLLAPLLEIGKPFNIESQVFTSYLDATLDFAGCGTLQQCLLQTHQWPASQAPLAWKAKSLYIFEELPRSSIARMLQWMMDPSKYRQCCSGQFAGFMLDAYGGVIANVAANATAFPHRKALYHIQLMGYWNASNSNDRNITETWLQAIYADLQSMIPPPFGSYRNYPDLDLGNTFMSMYYANNSVQLQQIKMQYDPKNIFIYPQSIPPLPLPLQLLPNNRNNNYKK